MQTAGWLLTLTTLAPVIGAAQSSDVGQKGFLWKQCDEDAIVLYIDPDPIARRLPENHALELDGGMARLLIAIQDCPTYWINGEDIGPTHEVHHWAALEGLADVRPVAGAELTLPTMTWFNLFTGSSNPKSREQWTGSGTMSSEIDKVSFVAPDPEGGGRVAISEGLGYSWDISRGQPIAMTVGVNHDVYSINQSGDLVYNRIQCLGSVFGWASSGSLRVTGGTEPSRLVGTGTYPVNVHTFLPIWCRASLADAPPQ